MTEEDKSKKKKTKPDPLWQKDRKKGNSQEAEK